jgi:hypothetical protein
MLGSFLTVIDFYRFSGREDGLLFGAGTLDYFSVGQVLDHHSAFEQLARRDDLEHLFRRDLFIHLIEGSSRHHRWT